MFRCVASLMVAALTTSAIRAVQADDAAKATIEKAIKATGWDKRKGDYATWKSKGKMKALEQEIEFGGDWKVDTAKGRYRMDIKINFGGMELALMHVYDGEKAFESAGGMQQDVEGPKLEYTKGVATRYRIMSLKPLLTDKQYTLKSVETKDVNGKPTVGVKVEAPGTSPVTMSFDKETGLPVKAEAMVKNEFEDWKEVLDETYFSDWKETADGSKEYKSMKVVRDGKPMIESTMSDYVVSEKPDWLAKAFVKP
jgi:hypothetical protein